MAGKGGLDATSGKGQLSTSTGKATLSDCCCGGVCALCVPCFTTAVGSTPCSVLGLDTLSQKAERLYLRIKLYVDCDSCSAAAGKIQFQEATPDNFITSDIIYLTKKANSTTAATNPVVFHISTSMALGNAASATCDPYTSFIARKSSGGWDNPEGDLPGTNGVYWMNGVWPQQMSWEYYLETTDPLAYPPNQPCFTSTTGATDGNWTSSGLSDFDAGEFTITYNKTNPTTYDGTAEFKMEGESYDVGAPDVTSYIFTEEFCIKSGTDFTASDAGWVDDIPIVVGAYETIDPCANMYDLIKTHIGAPVDGANVVGWRVWFSQFSVDELCYFKLRLEDLCDGGQRDVIVKRLVQGINPSPAILNQNIWRSKGLKYTGWDVASMLDPPPSINSAMVTVPFGETTLANARGEKVVSFLGEFAKGDAETLTVDEIDVWDAGAVSDIYCYTYAVYDCQTETSYTMQGSTNLSAGYYEDALGDTYQVTSTTAAASFAGDYPLLDSPVSAASQECPADCYVFTVTVCGLATKIDFYCEGDPGYSSGDVIKFPYGGYVESEICGTLDADPVISTAEITPCEDVTPPEQNCTIITAGPIASGCADAGCPNPPTEDV